MQCEWLQHIVTAAECCDESDGCLARFGVAPFSWQRAAVLFSIYHAVKGKQRMSEHAEEVERFLAYAMAAKRLHGFGA